MQHHQRPRARCGLRQRAGEDGPLSYAFEVKGLRCLVVDARGNVVLAVDGFRMIEVPVTMRERLSGISMHSGWKPFYYVSKMWLAIAMVFLRQKTHASARRLS